MHLVKLAVGISTINDLKVKQSFRFKAHNQNIHITRLFPKKFEIVKNKASMYWVINGHISVRQIIIDLKKVKHDDGKNYCHIILDKELTETRKMRYRPFQGWRYLSPEKCPKDLAIGKYGHSELYKILEDLCIV